MEKTKFKQLLTDYHKSMYKTDIKLSYGIIVVFVIATILIIKSLVIMFSVLALYLVVYLKFRYDALKTLNKKLKNVDESIDDLERKNPDYFNTI